MAVVVGLLLVGVATAEPAQMPEWEIDYTWTYHQNKDTSTPLEGDAQGMSYTGEITHVDSDSTLTVKFKDILYEGFQTYKVRYEVEQHSTGYMDVDTGIMGVIHADYTEVSVYTGWEYYDMNTLGLVGRETTDDLTIQFTMMGSDTTDQQSGTSVYTWDPPLAKFQWPMDVGSTWTVQSSQHAELDIAGSQETFDESITYDCSVTGQPGLTNVGSEQDSYADAFEISCGEDTFYWSEEVMNMIRDSSDFIDLESWLAIPPRFQLSWTVAATATAGETLEFPVNIKNAGDELVEDVIIELYRGTTKLGEETISEMASQASSTVTFNSVVPNTVGQTVNYEAKVKSFVVGGATEFGGPTLVAPVLVEAPTAKLRFFGDVTLPSNVEMGESVDVSFMVKNVGMLDQDPTDPGYSVTVKVNNVDVHTIISDTKLNSGGSETFVYQWEPETAGAVTLTLALNKASTGDNDRKDIQVTVAQPPYAFKLRSSTVSLCYAGGDPCDTTITVLNVGLNDDIVDLVATPPSGWATNSVEFQFGNDEVSAEAGSPAGGTTTLVITPPDPEFIDPDDNPFVISVTGTSQGNDQKVKTLEIEVNVDVRLIVPIQSSSSSKGLTPLEGESASVTYSVTLSNPHSSLGASTKVSAAFKSAAPGWGVEVKDAGGNLITSTSTVTIAPASTQVFTVKVTAPVAATAGEADDKFIVELKTQPTDGDERTVQLTTTLGEYREINIKDVTILPGDDKYDIEFKVANDGNIDDAPTFEFRVLPTDEISVWEDNPAVYTIPDDGEDIEYGAPDQDRVIELALHEDQTAGAFQVCIRAVSNDAAKTKMESEVCKPFSIQAITQVKASFQQSSPPGGTPIQVGTPVQFQGSVTNEGNIADIYEVVAKGMGTDIPLGKTKAIAPGAKETKTFGFNVPPLPAADYQLYFEVTSTVGNADDATVPVQVTIQGADTGGGETPFPGLPLLVVGLLVGLVISRRKTE